ncbi:hypothetical protein [Mycolicibacterium palauense]|uniref:hypothetical protein n=1 Tax=Mycolicibacterium palauense TaxID=2034511 RepID=UPI000BFEDA44|nr:hypothetical protein [Mycolicibacterium palauense]
MTQHRCDDPDTRRALRDIEQRVLEDIHVGAVQRIAGLAVAALLVAAAAALWLVTPDRSDPSQSGRGIAAITAALFTLAGLTTATALLRRRFRWSCAAVYVCGIAAVAGGGSFWWHHTGPMTVAGWWAAAGWLAATVLTVGWLRLVLTPIDDSQPDMRAATATHSRRGQL